MIYFFTGAPGTYKSYSAIVFARDLAKGERPVFTHGVSEIKVPGWNPLSLDDLINWELTLPEGAVVVVDEVATLIPQRTKGQPPAWIDSLRTHRHKGLDLIFITQHPMDVDVTFRRLVGEHRHFYRQFGRKQVTWIRSDAAMDNPDISKLQPGQTIEKKGVDKSVFALYKSTVLDTHKLRIPKKLIYSILFLIGAVIFAYFSIQKFTSDRIKPPQQLVATAKEKASTTPGPIGQERPQCIAWADKEQCWCYSQQGNRMTQISIAECRHIVKYGYFDPSLEKPSRNAER